MLYNKEEMCQNVSKRVCQARYYQSIARLIKHIAVAFSGVRFKGGIAYGITKKLRNFRDCNL